MTKSGTQVHCSQCPTVRNGVWISSMRYLPVWVIRSVEPFSIPKSSISQTFTIHDSAFQILRRDRSTSCSISHLKRKHHATKVVPPPGTSRPSDKIKRCEVAIDSHEEEEHSPFEQRRQVKERKQLPIDSFLAAKLTLRNDTQCLNCESNISFKQWVTSTTLRRLLEDFQPITSDGRLPDRPQKIVHHPIVQSEFLKIVRLVMAHKHCIWHDLRSVCAPES